MTINFVPMLFPDELFTSISNRHDQLQGAATTDASSTETTHSHRRGLNRYNALFKTNTLNFQEFAWSHTFAPLLSHFSTTEQKIRSQSTRSETKMCTKCIKSDIATFGVAYSHRSHNFPGIDVCHLHGTRLSIVCEVCDVSHARHKLSSYYSCATSPMNSQAGTVSEPTSTEHRLALFLHKYLNRPRELAAADRQELTLHSKAIDLGLYKTNQFSRNCIIDFTNEHYKNNPTNTIFDIATVSWSKNASFATMRVLFALFHTFEQYCHYYNNHSTVESVPGKIGLVLRRREELVTHLLESELPTIERFQEAHPILTAWLRKEDPSWTSATLCKHFASNSYTTRIQHRLSSIKALEPTLYNSERRPERVNFSQIWKSLGFKRKYQAKSVGKATRSVCEGLTESTHHYYVRLILWAARCGSQETMPIATLARLTEISARRLKPVLEHFDWLGSDSMIDTRSLPKTVSAMNINRKWTCPENL